MRIAIDGSIFFDKYTGIGHYIYHLLIEWSALCPDDQFIVYVPFKLRIVFKQENISVRSMAFKKTKPTLWYKEGKMDFL
jgi:hypothetical protein